MTTPIPARLSPRAKTMMAAAGATILAGVTAWQATVGGGPARPIDLLPVAVAVVGAAHTHIVPNLPGQDQRPI